MSFLNFLFFILMDFKILALNFILKLLKNCLRHICIFLLVCFITVLVSIFVTVVILTFAATATAVAFAVAFAVSPPLLCFSRCRCRFVTVELFFCLLLSLSSSREVVRICQKFKNCKLLKNFNSFESFCLLFYFFLVFSLLSSLFASMLIIAAPTSKPNIIEPVASTPRTLNISWSPIPRANRRGIIRHYVARCKANHLPEKNITVPSSAVLSHNNIYSAEFSGLEEHTRYSCELAAFTVREGPFATFQADTKEDGKNSTFLSLVHTRIF